MLADLAHTPTLDEVAQQLHMGRRTFSRQFRAATGMAQGLTPQQWWLQFHA